MKSPASSISPSDVQLPTNRAVDIAAVADGGLGVIAVSIPAGRDNSYHRAVRRPILLKFLHFRPTAIRSFAEHHLLLRHERER